jgi:chemotaxis protein histidine kinase CheA
LARDPDGFREFRISAESLVLAVGELPSRPEQLRALHTLKGNAALVGIASVAALCHQIEDEMAESMGPIEDEQAARLAAAWSKTEALMRSILGEREDVIELWQLEHSQLVSMLNEGVPHDELLAIAKDWRLESVPRRFERLALQAQRVGRALGKDIHVRVDVPPLRLDTERWRDFWLACTHLLRNSVDHGIENSETRLAQNKAETGTVLLSAHLRGEQIVVRLGDDGQGIDWSKVAIKAKARGLRCDSAQMLQDALFADGLTTCEEVTAVSGRGVGLGAMAQETHRMGGTIEVRSTRGVGTEFIIRVPYRSSHSVEAVQAQGVA